MSTPDSTPLPRKFTKLLLTREQYREVRDLDTDASDDAIKALSLKEIVVIRNNLRERLAETRASVQEIDGVRTVCVPSVTFQYIPASEQAAKLWAYRKGLTRAISTCDFEVKARTNRVSTLISPSAESLQAGAEPVATSEATSEVSEAAK